MKIIVLNNLMETLLVRVYVNKDIMMIQKTVFALNVQHFGNFIVIYYFEKYFLPI